MQDGLNLIAAFTAPTTLLRGSLDFSVAFKYP
jgi:hypothetical protein